MAVTLSDTRLWNVQEDRSQTDGNVRVDSVYGTDSDNTILIGFESQEKFTLTGEAVGTQLASQSEYSDNPLTALAQWVVEFETYVNGRQGSGWDLTDDERQHTINVVNESLGWERREGEKYSVSFDVTCHWARGMMSSASETPPSVSPSGPATIDGIELPSLLSWRHDIRQPIEVYPIAFADTGGNEVKAGGGAEREITLTGKYTDDPGSVTDEMNEFDDQMQSLVGQDKIVEFEEAFPGRTLSVMVRSYESTREAGKTRIGEYNMQLVEGET